MKIKISTDFSRIPAARYPWEGDFCGQDFRENVLLPKLKEAIRKNEKLYIDLDGTAGMGTSFLEESFGGLIRIDKISYEDIKKTIEFLSNADEDYESEIEQYLLEAKENEEKNK
jgi:hypothetical protein